MKASVEISYYPLKEEFIEPINDFIERLNNHKNLTVQTNGMSTQVLGDYFDIMDILTKEIHKSFVRKDSFGKIPTSVFVLKIINIDLK